MSIPPTSQSAASLDIPDHDLVREIGRGSYGEVWLARNVFGVYRAIKIVRRSSFDKDAPYQRELTGIRNFEPVSRSHPGFVAVLHVGENRPEGYFYYVMEIADDQQSGQQIVSDHYQARTVASDMEKRDSLGLQESIRIGLTMADALAALHNAGLIHRDIKPSNIIFVNGNPKLADIGLVHAIASPGTFVGTQGYMPPEGPGTVQADIYALGKLLYEISTGNDRQQFPEVPAWVAESPDSALFNELNEILLLACETDPKQRYASATQLHSDLELISGGRSLRRLRLLEKRWRLLSRIALPAVVIGIVIALFMAQRARVQRARASQVATDLAYGTRSLDEGDPLGALPWFVNALEVEEESRTDVTTHRTRVGSVLDQAPHLVGCWWQEHPVEYAEFSPDSQLIAFGDTSGQIHLMERASGKILRTMVHPESSIPHASFSPDGHKLVSTSELPDVCVWDADSGTLIRRWSPGDYVHAAQFSPDGRWLATVGAPASVLLWDTSNWNLVKEFRGHSDVVRSVAFSPDSQRLATGSQDGFAIVWNIATGAGMRGHFSKTWVNAVTFSPDGRLVASGGADDTVTVWNATNGAPVYQPLRHPMAVASVRFSPDSRLIAVASYAGSVHVWDMERLGAPFGVFRHADNVWYAAFSEDSRFLLTSSWDKTIRLWELIPDSTAPVPIRHTLSQDGKWRFEMASNQVSVSSTITGSQRDLIRPPYPPKSVIANRDGTKLLFVPGDTSATNVLGWDAAARREIRLPSLSGLTTATCFIANQASIAAILNGQSLTTWDLTNGTLMARWESPVLLGRAAISPDGTKVLAWPPVDLENANAYVIDAKTGRELSPPLTHTIPVWTAVFSENNEMLLTACRDNTLRHGYAMVWDTQKWKPVGPPMAHNDGVYCTTFSPDGIHVATGGEDNFAKVWNFRTGEAAYPVRHQRQVWSVNFTADGDWLVTGGIDDVVRVWDVKGSAPITPPLRAVGFAANARMIDGRRTLAVTTSEKITRLFTMPLETRAVAELKVLATFLKGDLLTNAVDRNCVLAYASTNAWLAANVPADKWHYLQALQSDRVRGFFGARFHLERALALGLNDPERTRALGLSERPYAMLAKMQAELGEWKAADRTLQLALKESDIPELEGQLVLVHLMQGHLAECRELVTRLAGEKNRTAPEVDDSCWNLAVAAAVLNSDIDLSPILTSASRQPLSNNSLPLCALLARNRHEPSARQDFFECVGALGPSLAPECHAVYALFLREAGLLAEAASEAAAAQETLVAAKSWQQRARVDLLLRLANDRERSRAPGVRSDTPGARARLLH